MDSILIPLHEGELPDQIDVTRKTSELTCGYSWIFRWDGDGYAEYLELRSPPEFPMPDKAKLLGQALIDNDYSCVSDKGNKRTFKRDADLPNYYVQLGINVLGLR